MNITIKILKASLTVLWTLTIAGLLDISPLPQLIQFYLFIIATGVLLIHLIEYYYLRVKFERETTTTMNFIQTMLWGFGYWLPIRKRVQTENE